MLIREGDAQRSSMMQCKKRPGDVAIEPLVSFKKTVSMEKKKKNGGGRQVTKWERCSNLRKTGLWRSVQ